MPKQTNPFKLKNFRGVDMQSAARLIQAGLKTAPQRLDAAAQGSQLHD